MEICIFCKIVNKEIPAAIVYEDGDVMAFMTIEAINEGHTLVIPKTHIPAVHDMDEALYTQVMLQVRRLSDAVSAVFQPKKVGLMVSGWEVPHAHVHVVPMNVPSDITSKKLLENQALSPSPEELKDHSERIKNKLAAS